MASSRKCLALIRLLAGLGVVAASVGAACGLTGLPEGGAGDFVDLAERGLSVAAVAV